jgi:hypothetical protein
MELIIGVNAAGDASPAMFGLQGTVMESVPPTFEEIASFFSLFNG